MWTKLKTYGLVLLTLGASAACGQTATTDTESGETHFISCSTNQDCASVNSAHTCDGGLCRGPVNAPASTPAKLACDAGCGNSECATPGSCRLESACGVVDCGSVVFDETACVRPNCDDDSGCPDDQRCTATWLGRHYQCEQKGASCECQAGLGLFPLNICSPVALVGMRGQWQKLVVNESAIGDSTQHTITPDGGVVTEQVVLGMTAPPATSAQLSSEDLDAITRLINGPQLRVDLAKPEPCATTKALEVAVDLQLDSSTLSKDVAGCLQDPNPVASFQSLMDLVRKY